MLDWTISLQRKSLVKALKLMTELGIIKLMDGLTEDLILNFQKMMNDRTLSIS